MANRPGVSEVVAVVVVKCLSFYNGVLGKYQLT